MRSLVLGMSLLAVISPAVLAQQDADPAVATSQMVEPGRYRVFFEFDSAALTADAESVIAQAAEEFQRTGAAQLELTGHADRAGSADYNLMLSDRRIESVRDQLVSLGVPAGQIVTLAEGEMQPLVPTADGVREALNRRVEIMVPQPLPATVAEPVTEPVETAAPEAEAERRGRFTFAVGPLVGHNFKEQDEGETENDLVGAELTFDALPGFFGGLSLKQGILWSVNGVDDGLVGRTVLGLNFAPDLGVITPFLGLNFGGVYGEGVQDGLVAGPEAALAFNITEGFSLRPKVAYDYQFRNAGLDEGILWAGLDFGLRF